MDTWELDVGVIKTREDIRRFDRLLEKEHYLGRPAAPRLKPRESTLAGARATQTAYTQNGEGADLNENAVP